ncbi:hypothetical protein WICPIJ_000307 [Wickerhamomyces pijperi]|uniref:Serine hydrolase domain-containing protein n=1 Tax=Wickerhamomyces pijperi TaxID=599730 RepID=A0A9P8QGX8_WICPI|nr:hypothetical protein WICPIJ_000307 [Wickerhamomyces pijperi]
MSKKILFLHGYAQSASIYSAKTGALRKTLQKGGYETVYLQGPYHIPSDDEIAGSGIDLYGWWPYNLTQFDITAGLEEFKEKAKEHGDEVEGIIGFSQGAGLSGVIAAQYKEILPGLKWVILFSGFKLNPKEYDVLYENEIQIPTLHVLGELDTVVDEGRSMRLYNVCKEDQRTLLKHQGGHFVPNSKDFVSKVINWIQTVKAQDDSSKEAKEETDINDDSDLLDAIDNIGKA